MMQEHEIEHDMIRVTRCVQTVHMCNAWTRHEKCTCGARCVKYTTNEPNMYRVRKHEKCQSLVLIGVQTSEKMPKRKFIKHLACTLTRYIWWNEWAWQKQTLILVINAIRGQHPKKNIKRNKTQSTKIEKNWQIVKFPNSQSKANLTLDFKQSRTTSKELKE